MSVGRSGRALRTVAGWMVAGLAWSRGVPAQGAAVAVDDVCVGAAHSCARAHDGRVACWGDNGFHQVSSSDVSQLDEPRWVTDLPAASRLRCAPQATCIETPAGGVICQGFRYHDASRINRSPDLPATHSKVALPRQALDFVATDGGGCAILDDHALWCWSDENPAAPVAAPGVDDAVAFVVRPLETQRACVQRARHEPACVRVGGRDPRNPGAGFPVHVEPMAGPVDAKAIIASTPLGQAAPAGASALALSAEHACAVVAGSALCWGAASHGQLGDGTSYEHGPLPVPGIADATKIAARAGMVCAARTSPKITCWGRAQPSVTSDESGFSNIATRLPATELAIGPERMPCARFANKPACWDGVRWRAVKSGGVPTDKLDPAFGPGPRSVSSDGSCAIDRKNRLGCLVVAPGTPAAEQVAWISGPFAEVASFRYGADGRQMACARAKDGHAACFVFGGPADGGKLVPAGSPILAALVDVTKIAAATDSPLASASDRRVGMACALMRDGGVTCWGGPHAGTLAVQRIDGLPPATDAAVGGAFACAATKDGRVLCWGSNSDNGAPDGAPRRRAQPLSVRWPPPP